MSNWMSKPPGRASSFRAWAISGSDWSFLVARVTFSGSQALLRRIFFQQSHRPFWIVGGDGFFGIGRMHRCHMGVDGEVALAKVGELQDLLPVLAHLQRRADPVVVPGLQIDPHARIRHWAVAAVKHGHAGERLSAPASRTGRGWYMVSTWPDCRAATAASLSIDT